MAAQSTEWRPAPPPRTVSESTRQRETFKYDSSLLTTLRVNDTGAPLPTSELLPSQDRVLTGLAQLAVLQTGTQRALISLFDMEHQYFIAEATNSPLINQVSEFWMCGTAIPRSHSVCEHTLLARDPAQFRFCDKDPNQLPVLIVPDLTTDTRFAAKPYCKPGSAARFYASVPIRTQRGISIGVLAVMRPEPDGEWDDDLSQLLRYLAVTIMDHLEANRSKTAHRRSERMIRGLGFFVEGKSMSSSWHSIPGRPTFTDSQEALNLARQVLLQEPVDQSPDQIEPEPPLPPIAGPSSRPDSSHKKDRPGKAPAEMKWDESFQPGPNPMIDTFSEAANIIRESLETDGCLFLDATLGSFGAFDSRHHESKKTHTTSQPSSSSSSSGSGSGSDDDQCSSSAEPVWPPCQVLGYSASDSRRVELGDSPKNVSMAQKFLAKLLQRYPKGHIFNFDANGELQSSDSSDDDGWMLEPISPPPPGKLRQNAPEGQRSRRPWARQNEGRVILEVFPGARSVAFIPVWDPRKQRWCAGGFVYTLTPTRIFTIEGELNYLRAFGILAIAETLRLKTLAANQAKSDALGSLSHELRSPLHGAVLGIELLRDTELTVFQSNVAHTIETCCRTLVDTVDHLLDYSKVNKFIQSKRKEKQEQEPRGLRPGRARSVEAGMLSLYKHIRLDGLVEEVMDGVYAGFNFQHMSVTQLAKPRPTFNSDLTAIRRLDSMQAMEELGPNITDKGDKYTWGEVTVFLDIDPMCSWRFYTQPGAIRRIVMNLFGNALKYTRKGTIKVSVYQSKPKPNSHSTETGVNIIVADTGKGISEDYLRNELYKPFSQEDHLAPGTGLGLSFVKQITTQLRGHVTVDSRVDVGTTVRVSLPLTRTLTAPDNIPLPSENERDFEKQVEEITDIKIRLMGFDAHKRAERPMLDGEDVERHALVERVCREWLHLNVITDTREAPDLILWAEEALATSPVQEETGPPVVVMCQNALIAYQSAAKFERLQRRRVFEFVAQPLGPRKLAKALSLAYKRWKDLEANPLPPSDPPQVSPLTSSETLVNVAETPPATTTSTTMPPSSIPDPDPLPERTSSPEKSILLAPAFTTVPEFLLVEDNSINLNILSIYMKKLGRPYHTATNGAEAFHAYKANPDHCKYIFMDISMPIMDGFEATRCIRAYERENQLKPAVIFALTGLASESAQQEALGSGVDLFLTKPVKLKELGMILKSRGLLNDEELAKKFF